MECPKCVGKLQEFNIRVYTLPQMTETPYIGWNWGVQSSKVFRDQKQLKN